MKKTLITLSLTALLVTNTANAEQASEESIRKLLNFTGAGDLGVQVTRQLTKQLKPLMPLAPESFWQDFEQQANAEELINMVAPIYQKHLSQSDIDAVTAFYQTPAGKKFIAVQPQILQESMQAGQQWGQSLARKLVEKYKKQYQQPQD